MSEAAFFIFPWGLVIISLIIEEDLIRPSIYSPKKSPMSLVRVQ